MKKIIAVLIILLLSVAQAHAWKMTKELEQEIQQKKSALKENDPNSHFDLAITYAYSNKVEEGWGLLKKVDQMDPNFKNKAWIIYTEKATQNLSDWKLRFRLGFALYFAGKKNEAIREFKNVLVIDPYNPWAYGYIGLVYGEMGETDKAIAAIRKGLEIDPLIAALHLLLSQGLYKKGDSWGGFMEAATAVRLRAQGY